MLVEIDLRSGLPALAVLNNILPKVDLSTMRVVSKVAEILSDVKERGVAAALNYSEQFDKIQPKTIKVSSKICHQALRNLPKNFLTNLEIAIENCRKVHKQQNFSTYSIETVPGGKVYQNWVPVERVGLYVPGGSAVYPSSVIMNVIPAQIAGVKSVVIASPPQIDTGLPHSTIMAASALLEVDELWSIGGAQAIGLLAYGGMDTDDSILTAVNMITGPGNIYVATAKSICNEQGLIGIDAKAGPTEIAIIADETANPRYVAADLISQAEHDVLAAAILVTPSVELLAAVQTELTIQVASTKHKTRIKAALTGSQSAAILTANLEDAITIVNAYAPEHLEIQTKNNKYISNQIRNAGAIFIGPYSPVALGDYCAGSNHVLPTLKSAKYASGLNVGSFLKLVSTIEYSKSALSSLTEIIQDLAIAEDLPAHAAAISQRKI